MELSIDNQIEALKTVSSIVENAAAITNAYSDLQVAIQKELNELERIRNEGERINLEHIRNMQSIDNAHIQRMSMIKIAETGLAVAQERGNLKEIEAFIEVLKLCWG